MADNIEVKLPRTADDVDESVVVLWYKSEGHRVEKYDALLEVQSEKATFEVEAPASGVLRDIRVRRSEVAAVGDVLAVIEVEAGGGNEAAATVTTSPQTAESAEEGRSAQSAQSDPPSDPGQLAQPSRRTGSFVPAPPRIRRLASQLGVDLGDITGTGPNGRITEDDVREAAESGESHGGDVRQAGGAEPALVHQSSSGQDEAGASGIPSAQTTPLSPVRTTIAKRMMQSLQQSAQLTLTAWADVSTLAERKNDLAPGVSWNTWVIRAVTQAFQDMPDTNMMLEEDRIRQLHQINIGMAVDTDAGLLVPVIHDAGIKDLHKLQVEAESLAEKARDRRLTAEEMSGGTFTVTNLGTYGVEFFTPIINPPEWGILGVGKIDEKLVLRDKSITMTQRIPLSLTFDHRILDGGPAAKFLQAIAANLADPDRLV